ncbi:M56 family metallopeptidase [Limnoglobus roseus]|uniref:PDZ domain-containing protein n=1 Tax=Limnoglobus roseus TaxID=2598579 RepID=A0A5C1AFR1_9BACT|nr:M56 family metallopeptidase [Limnoglobus roseus]QEL15984.1 PDZ domain-containing protein [Limnoglobus roseus]
MSDFWPAAAIWTARSLLAGGAALLLTWLAVRRIGDPARRQRVLAGSMRAAVLAFGLTLLPAWLLIPVPGWQKPAETASRFEPVPDATQEAVDAEPEEFGWVPVGVPVSLPADGGVELLLPTEPSITPIPAAAVPAPALPEDSLAAVAPILLIPYWLGVSFVLLRQLVGHVGLARLRRAARPAPDDVQTLAAELAGDMRMPRVLVSDRVGAPVCFGVFRPTVLLPRVLPTLATPDQLRWVLAHELDHLQRGDPRTGVWAGLAGAVYFTLPWFWAVRQELNLAQEYLADAAAAGSREADYAAFLVDLSSRPGVPRSVRAVPSLAGVRAGQSDLYRRVTMLLQPKTERKSRWGRAWSALALSSAVTAAVAISGVRLTADEPRKGDKPEEGKKVERRDGDRKPEEGKRDGDRKLEDVKRDGDRKPATVREVEVRVIDGTRKDTADLEMAIEEAAKKGDVEGVKKLVAKLKAVAALSPAQPERGLRVEGRLADRVPEGAVVRVRAAVADDEAQKLEKAIEKLKQAAEEVKDQPEAKAAIEKSIAEYRKKIAEAKKSGELRLTEVKPRAVEGQQQWQGLPQARAMDQLKASMDEMMKTYEKQLAALGNDPKATEAMKEAMKAYRASMDQLTRQMAQVPGQFEFKAMPPMAFNLNGPVVAGNVLARKVPASGRLGVMIEAVPAVVAEQLDLPAGTGVVLLSVIPDSPAAKAGLKAHDILLDIAGKTVRVDDLTKVVTDQKADAPFEVVIVRKGKKETVKGLTLPDLKATAVKKSAGSSSSMSVSINDDQFTIASKEGKDGINLKGTVGDTESVTIVIQNGDDKKEYKGVKNVPAEYRDKVTKLLKSVSK